MEKKMNKQELIKKIADEYEEIPGCVPYIINAIDAEGWLNERRTIHDAATEGPWGYIKDTRTDGMKVFRVGSEITGEDLLSIPRCRHDWDGVHIADAVADAHNTLPALLTAVEKVLEMHKPWGVDGMSPVYCSVCLDEGGDLEFYPCPTVRAIEGAINEH